MQIIQIKKTHNFLLIGILVLSGFVHLYNAQYFPDIFFDEGIYMRRAMNVIETGNPQEGYFYDHPYFGQLLLGGFLKITGFPEIVQGNIEFSYLLPRILMGLFAIIDTLLIYKISEKKFGRNVAIIASVIFAVMPITWMLRRILLDNILLPFMLSSILLAIYSKDSKHQSLFIVSSGILLGVSVFTKLTAVTMIPVVACIVYTNHKRKFDLIKLFSGTFGIPFIWPLFSIYLKQFDLWLRDVFWQAGRGSGGFFVILLFLFKIDPVFMTLSFVSFGFAIWKRQFFLIFWFAPFFLFVSFVGFLQYFHFILILPVMSIAIGYFIDQQIKKISTFYGIVFPGIIIAIIIFGLFYSVTLTSVDLTSSQFSVFDNVLSIYQQDTTLLAGPVYTWVFEYVYQKDNVWSDYSLLLFEPLETKNAILISDPHFLLDLSRGEKLYEINENYQTVHVIVSASNNIDKEQYPFTSLKYAMEGNVIKIKNNYNSTLN